MKKIAIIGAGFSGLSTCWHLLNQGGCEVLIFDKKGIGGGASGMAAGLLHPYAGAHAKLNRLGLEGMAATHQLLKVAERQLGKAVAQNSGILRIALDDAQKTDYQLCASKFSDVDWWEEDQIQGIVPGIVDKPGIWIKQGLAVNCSLYLQGLWQACRDKGATLEIDDIKDFNLLNSFDAIVITAGAGIQALATLKLSHVKGQLIEFGWPNLPPLPMPVNSYVYMVKHPSKNSCFAGATYERQFTDDVPDPTKATAEILPQVQSLFPSFTSLEVLGCQSGIRVFNPNHQPSFGKITDKVWFLTGMGSKGLLYHALYGEKLAQAIFGY